MQLLSGHRFRTFNDFGFVSLDILTMYPEDSGVYACVARNSLGEALTQCEVVCLGRFSHSVSGDLLFIGFIVSEFTGKAAILAQTHHPASVQRIADLEAPKRGPDQPAEGPKQAPEFIQQLIEPPEVKESHNVHLECQLLPVDDPGLQVLQGTARSYLAH